MSTLTEPTYGNFRRPRKPGLFGLSLGASLALAFAACILLMLTITGQLLLALLWVGFVAVAVAPLVVPTRSGWTVYHRAGRWLSWKLADKAGETTLSQGPVGLVKDGKCRLPGLMSPSELREYDSHTGRFGLITVPKTNHHSVVIECAAAGVSGRDQSVIDTEIARWGAWLAMLGTQEALAGASVTVETAPDTGHRLRRAALSGVSEDGPAFSKAVLEEAVSSLPASSAVITTRIALTWSGAAREGTPRRSVDEMAEEIAARMPSILAGLASGTGAGTNPRLCTGQEIIDNTRSSFDPASASDIDELRESGQSTGLTWEEVGPLFAKSEYGAYRHDGAVSVSWQMAEPPRGQFYGKTLKHLLDPHKGIARKRVTILYRPEDPIRSAASVESDLTTAEFMAKQKMRPSARGRADIAAARRTAEEEAAGAALVRFGMVVTITVLDRSQLPEAMRAVRGMAAPTRIRLRQAFGSQDTTFLAGLPLGLVLPAHMLIPSELREAM